ncbi:hypothetical protein predicted by Glimmer/Critica [Bdellovibrio bacteriovorus HD100]|uniref:Uncharacterized protein n=1 Tax=Bdellovibrio bacteriovorus (strain ATCC 15356 / DSM 50701 / NCIMB 9529 / HD100) TaxID=264462 RepID=Q6MJN9_BDEBA|nr:hypothetical protein predicted by Glimmer/Critica [Bdellovibrio bacteriovorus HD100]
MEKKNPQSVTVGFVLLLQLTWLPGWARSSARCRGYIWR